MKNFSLKDSGLGFLLGISLSMGLFIVMHEAHQEYKLPQIEKSQELQEAKATFNIPENSLVVPRPEVIWAGGVVGTSRADLEGQLALFAECLEEHFDKYSDYYTEKNNNSLPAHLPAQKNPYKP